MRHAVAAHQTHTQRDTELSGSEGTKKLLPYFSDNFVIFHLVFHNFLNESYLTVITYKCVLIDASVPHAMVADDALV